MQRRKQFFRFAWLIDDKNSLCCLKVSVEEERGWQSERGIERRENRLEHNECLEVFETEKGNDRGEEGREEKGEENWEREKPGDKWSILVEEVVFVEKLVDGYSEEEERERLKKVRWCRSS